MDPENPYCGDDEYEEMNIFPPSEPVIVPEFTVLSGTSGFSNEDAIRKLLGTVVKISQGNVCTIIHCGRNIVLKVYPISDSKVFSSFLADEYVSKTIQGINQNPKTAMAIPTFVPYHAFVICRDGIFKYINSKFQASLKRGHGMDKICGIKIMVSQASAITLGEFMDKSRKSNMQRFIIDMSFIMLVGTVSMNNLYHLTGGQIRGNDGTVQNWLVTSAFINTFGGSISNPKSEHFWAQKHTTLPVYGPGDKEGEVKELQRIELNPNEAGIILSFSDMDLCTVTDFPCFHLNDPSIALWGITTAMNRYFDMHCFLCSIYLEIKNLSIRHGGLTDIDILILSFINSHIDSSLLDVGTCVRKGTPSVIGGESIRTALPNLVEGRLSAFPNLVHQNLFKFGVLGIHMAYNRIHMAFSELVENKNRSSLSSTTSTSIIPDNYFEGFFVPHAATALTLFFQTDFSDPTSWSRASEYLHIFNFEPNESQISNIWSFIKSDFFKVHTVSRISHSRDAAPLWFWKQLQTAELLQYLSQ